MLQWMARSLQWLQGETSRLLLLAGGVLLVWGILSPVGTLTWWLKQTSESLGVRSSLKQPTITADTPPPFSNIDCYIVFFTGVGDFSADQITPGEEWFLDRLTKLHPNCVAVRDVFPYSVANEGLGGNRLLAPLWRRIEQADGWLETADVLIKIRNLWRFAIAADARYGTVYNQGVATAVIDRMNAVHPLVKQQQRPLKLILIGTSGGAQVALGAADYLDQWLDAELIVVSIGGCFDGVAGFDAAQQVYHLYGDRDWIEDLGLVFASRWPWTVGSPFNQARQQQRYTTLRSGPHAHDGAEGYFGRTAIENRGLTYVELTVQAVNQLPIWSK